MTVNKPIFELHGWTIEFHPSPEQEDYEWVVYDRDHDEYGCEETQEEAIALCRTSAIAHAKERLWDEIVLADLSAVSLETLQQIAKLLGLEAE
jgi:hypothetical protein